MVLLNENYLSNEYENLTEITKLDLSQSGITSIDPKTFDNLCNLTNLNLSENQITSIDAKLFSSLSNLTVLWLFTNQITSIDPKTFNNLSNLTDLQLTGNQITAVDSKTFKNLSNLTDLSLCGNQITSIDSEIFKNLCNLTKLNLSNNQITSIDPKAFNNLINLTELDLHGNQITTIDPKTFNNLNSLTSLDLSANEIASIDAKTFNNLSNLAQLFILNNQITSIDPKTFNNLSNLKLLYLSQNQLTSADPKIFSNLIDLTNLDLSENQITSIDPKTFNNLSNLTQLELYGNPFSQSKISNIVAKIFRGLKNLKYLYLVDKNINSCADFVNEIKKSPFPVFKNKGDFETFSYLDSGHFGDVYLIYDRSSNTKKAVKILKDNEKFENVDTQKMIIAEVEVLEKLDSPFIIKYFEFFKYDDDEEKSSHMCISTEYCNQGDLRGFLVEKISDKEQIDEKLVYKWTFQLLSALNYLHHVKEGKKQKRVLHRDIKPENIYLSGESIHKSDIKLGDFGLAYLVYGTTKMNSVETSGTVAYMSPEKINGILSYSSVEAFSFDDLAKSDVWSAGCVLYELSELKFLFDPFQRQQKLSYSITHFDPNEIQVKNIIVNSLLKFMLDPDLKKRKNSNQLFEKIKTLIEVMELKDKLNLVF